MRERHVADGGWLRPLAPVLLVAVVACGGEPVREQSEQKGEGARPETAASGEVPGGPRFLDICSLLDVEELESAFGEALVTGQRDSGEDWAACEWLDAAHSHFRMSLAVYFRGGREAWRIEHAARAGAERMIEAQEHIQVDSIVRPGPVTGLGDAAHYNALLPSQVLIGDTLISFTMPLMIESDAYFRPLAQKVIRRLRTTRKSEREGSG